MNQSVKVITAGSEEIRAILNEVLDERERRQRSGAERMSAAQAARTVRRARGLILAACASGALPASRAGTHWKISPVDLDAWAKAGFRERP